MRPPPKAGRMLALLLLLACLLSFLAGALPALAPIFVPLLAVGVAAVWLLLLRPLVEGLRSRAADAEDMIDRAPCGFHSLDAEGRFVRINDTALSWLGYTREEVLGKSFRDLIAPECHEQFDASFAEYLKGGEARDRQYLMVRKDGSQLPVLLNASAVRGKDGSILRSRSAFIDLTASREAAEALERARADAERANEAKSAFLASMSHELRTPLAGVIGLAGEIGQGPLDDDQRRHLATLSASAESMLALLNGILDLAKVEAGKVELERIPFSPAALAAECAAVLAPTAVRKGLAFRTEVAEGLPRLLGDPARLRQVLLNLLGNAVKFTSAGEVVLSVEKNAPPEAQEQHQIHLLFTVTDTGIGIPAERLATIFEPFAQAGPSTARTHGGTGLGLSISARLVERMGGCLQVRSQPGEGSAFSFSVVLPAAPEEASPLEPAPAREQPVPPLRVLVAEDTAINQEVLMHMLRRLGCQHALARDGAEAVEMAGRETFSLVLMDVQMPVMDGLRAARLIRAREKATGGRLPIVAVTANAMQGERERCLAAGMDGYLTKPVRFEELAAVLRTHGGRSGPEAPPATPDAPDWQSSLAAIGFDREATARLARTFADTVPVRLGQLRQSVEAGDAARAAATAHSLRGSLTVFGATEAVACASAVEQAVLAGRLEEAGREAARLERLAAPLVHSVAAHLAG